MIWELGLDTANNDALIGLFGEDAVEAGKRDSSLNPAERDRLAFDLSAYTGQNCYPTVECMSGQRSQVCKAGYSSVATGGAFKYHVVEHKIAEQLAACTEYPTRQHICCPTKAMPKNCEWLGAPYSRIFGCHGNCGESQFELNADTYYLDTDEDGYKTCGTGHRSLCCDSTDILQKCKWTSDCYWSPDDDKNGNCDTGMVQVAKRYDAENGGKFIQVTETRSPDGE